jgi:hypothetical protein
MTVYIVQYRCSDPWYSPSFGGVFDSVDKARTFAEKGMGFDAFYDRFKWESDGQTQICSVWDDDYQDYEETNTFIEEVEMNPKWGRDD